MSHNMYELKKHTFIVMGVEHYTPLGAIRSLGESGIRPVAIIIRNKWNKVASASKYISKLYKVDCVEDGYELLKKLYGDEHPKPFVILCDDAFTAYIDQRYDEIKDLFYVSNAKSENGGITFFQDKEHIARAAEKCGLNIAKIWRTKKGEIPEDIDFPIITKTVDSNSGGWKTDYHICNNIEELMKAYEIIKADEILLQRYIKKINEFDLDGISINNGKEWIAIASSYTYIIPNGYSNEIVFKNFKDTPKYHEIKKSLDSLFAEIGYEGIYSLEFLVDENGDYWFTEINFRFSGWSYVGTALDMNFVLLWAEGMLTKRIPDDVLKPVPEGFRAIAEFADFKIRVRGKMISLKEWMERVKSCDVTFFYNKNDKWPFYTALFTKFANNVRLRLKR